MLHHFRFHRPSPTSPAPQLPSPSNLNASNSPLTPDAASSLGGLASPAASSSLPPALPPISKVTSNDQDPGTNERHDAKPPLADGRSSQAPARASYNAGSGFIGGVAWRKYRRDGGAQQPAGRESLEDDSRALDSKPVAFQTDLPTESVPVPHRPNNAKSTSSFSSSYYSSNSSTTSHRPPSSKMGSELLPALTVITSNEHQKGKKGLPFLKNPMSTLLLRRKANQSGRNKLPVSLDSPAEEPLYDPRIKGTRVHDFSAPRRQASAPTTSFSSSVPPANFSASYGYHTPQKFSILETLPEGHQRQPSNISDYSHTQSATTSPNTFQDAAGVSSVTGADASTEQNGPAPPVPSKENILPSVQNTPLKISGLRNQDADTTPKLLGSSRTARSRSVSLSSIPRHMTSTSSRFSFDMIGAAKQEKILEERHRQRELEKKAAVADAPRTSMYDDLDEDEFDYDAMMYDDGLEERIPGVNADYDDDQFIDGNFDDGNFDDDADPDNDQENFAGFVFQRSNPGSATHSSRATGTVRTLRDGFDEDTGMNQLHAMPPHSQGLYGTPETQANAPDSPNDGQAAAPRDFRDDELYFGGDVTGFEDEFAEDLATEPEGDGVPFDESIFDDNDTDQFGRPLPGVFALAQSLRRAVISDMENYVSSEASGLSTPSALRDLRPPGPTSFGFDEPQPPQEQGEREEEKQEEDEKQDTPASSHEAGLAAPMSTDPTDGDVVAAYQAALAAAAHKAAASGKFERSSTPKQGEADGQTGSFMDPSYPEADYGDPYEDYGYVDDGIEDYELDDDAIIAEANASALANDTDGWYGQEFGFYSAPMNYHAAQNANKESYGYANGGFFGPKGLSGLGRTTSGRVVSREPNLTPITERSEYSNRNSLMSLVMPNVNSGTPTFQSPGLAQLQMMADRGDDMTLSALLRLRSKAFGGSSVSLASSKDGSPRSEWGDASCSPRTGNFAGHYPGPSGAHGRKNSVFSIVGRDSDGGSGSGSPILKLAIPSVPNLLPTETGVMGFDIHVNPASAEGNSTHFVSSTFRDTPPPATVCTNDGRDVPASSVSRSSSNSLGFAPDGSSPIVSYALMGHQRRKDSADSISYRQEGDSGDTRWVMERRRTGEFGQVEIVEREVVEGGRI